MDEYYCAFKNKERGKRLKLLILEGVHIKKKRQWKLEHSNLEIGDRVVLDNIDWRIIKILDKKERPKKPKVAKGVVFSEFAMLGELLKTEGEKPNIILCYHRKAGRNTAYEYMKHLKFDKKGNIIDPDPRGKRLSYNSDLIDHLMRTARCKERSKLIHTIDEREKLKEFHKRPYFKTTVEIVKGKPQGKENLKKIKFPCYCSYVNFPGLRELGQINKGRNYELFHVGKQGETNYVDGSFQTLKGLMKVYNIEILKGELKLWKVVK